MKKLIVLSSIGFVLLVLLCLLGVSKLNEINANYNVAISLLKQKNKDLEGRNAQLTSQVNSIQINYITAKSETGKQQEYASSLKQSFEKLNQEHQLLVKQYGELKVSQNETLKLKIENAKLLTEIKETKNKSEEVSRIFASESKRNSEELILIKNKMVQIKPVCPQPVVRLFEKSEVTSNRMPATEKKILKKKQVVKKKEQDDAPVDKFN